MAESKGTVGSATREIVDGVSDLAGNQTLKGEWFGVGRILERAVKDAVGDLRGPRLGESMTITRRKGGPSFLLVAGLLVMVCGGIALVLTALMMVEAGAAGVIAFAVSLAIIGTSILLLAHAMSLLRPGEVTIDSRGIRLYQDGALRKEIGWGERTVVMPWVNHALGFDEFYGFYVKEGRTTISLSPDEGWPREELKLAVLLVLKNSLDKDAEISKDFLKIRGLWPS